MYPFYRAESLLGGFHAHAHAMYLSWEPCHDAPSPPPWRDAATPTEKGWIFMDMDPWPGCLLFPLSPLSCTSYMPGWLPRDSLRVCSGYWPLSDCLMMNPGILESSLNPPHACGCC